MKKFIECFFGIVVLAIAFIGFPFVAPILENPAPVKSIRAEIEQARYNDIHQILPDSVRYINIQSDPNDEFTGEIVVDTTQVQVF